VTLTLPSLTDRFRVADQLPFPSTVPLTKFTGIHSRRLPTSSTAVTPGKKKYPWKNVPPWSPLYRKLQQRSDKSLDNPNVDTLHTSTDDLIQDSVGSSKAADGHNDNGK